MAVRLGDQSLKKKTGDALKKLEDMIARHDKGKPLLTDKEKDEIQRQEAIEAEAL